MLVLWSVTSLIWFVMLGLLPDSIHPHLFLKHFIIYDFFGVSICFVSCVFWHIHLYISLLSGIFMYHDGVLLAGDNLDKSHQSTLLCAHNANTKDYFFQSTLSKTVPLTMAINESFLLLNQVKRPSCVSIKLQLYTITFSEILSYS